MANRVRKRNNILKALAGTNWGNKRKRYCWHIKHWEDRLLTTLHLSGAHMLARPAWKIYNAHRMKQALRIITGSHKMSSISTFTMRPRYDWSWTTSIFFFCAISSTLSRHRECLPPHHHDGSSNEGKKREFNGTSTHLLDGYISANQRFCLHSWIKSRSIIGFPWDGDTFLWA